MKFVNVKQIKNSAVTSLLLLLLVASSNANPLRRCGENRFFDRVAQICTNCDDICDPRRGTQYMCDRYADECLRTLPSTTTTKTTRPIATSFTPQATRSSQFSLSMILFIITVLCLRVAATAVIALAVFICKKRSILCFRNCADREGKHTGFTASPATRISGSKEAIAPTQIKLPVSDVGARLISQAAAEAADNDVDAATG